MVAFKVSLFPETFGTTLPQFLNIGIFISVTETLNATEFAQQSQFEFECRWRLIFGQPNYVRLPLSRSVHSPVATVCACVCVQDWQTKQEMLITCKCTQRTRVTVCAWPLSPPLPQQPPTAQPRPSAPSGSKVARLPAHAILLLAI